METNQCIGIMGKIFGHKFEERYDVTSTLNPKNAPDRTISLAFGEEVINSYKDTIRVYKYDICTRCGMTIDTVAGKGVSGDELAKQNPRLD